MSEKSPLLIAVHFDSMRENDTFEKGLAGRPVIDWLKGDPPRSLAGIRYALVWKPEPALFEAMPDLEVIFSAGAGVDHIFKCRNLPDLPVVRFVDPTLTTRMSEWIALQCLMHLRQQRDYDRQQRAHEWRERPQPEASEITVGIMGLGVLGQDAARKLSTLGFSVNGWSRSKKEIAGIKCFGGDELDPFLRETDILIGLLPFTEKTRGFFNRGVFEKLARREEIASPVFINAGRGGSQVETDIISCLKDGTLGGVSLDVFETEPLPADSPLWDFERAILTPHMAATSDIAALGAFVDRQIERYEAGEPLQHLADRNKGY